MLCRSTAGNISWIAVISSGRYDGLDSAMLFDCEERDDMVGLLEKLGFSKAAALSNSRDYADWNDRQCEEMATTLWRDSP